MADATETTFAANSAAVIVTDPASLPDEPPPQIRYRHRANLLPSLGELWGRRDMVLTLAERDIRASYKQASLGIAWAVITPVVQLVIFTVIFRHVTSFQVPHVPYPVYAYSGIVAWSYFASSLGSGGSSMLTNMPLLQKTYFPRACFPLSQMLEAAFYTTIALVPLGILFAMYGFTPKPEIVWAPLFVAIELAFTTGIVLAFSALIVHVRDLLQVVGLLTQLGLLATPVIWKFSNISHGWQFLYGLLNPIGPVIDDIRRTMLLGLQPDWPVLGTAALGALGYLVGGYAIFKRLEVGFADLA